MKAELKDVADAIGDLFIIEQENFKESANEVLEDLDRKIGDMKSKLSGQEDHPAKNNGLTKNRVKTPVLGRTGAFTSFA
ncbi:MAG: hypothetical protein KGY60_01690 [Bacteroidales bacterium]|nr:hypothetical protein [Bacteroidales bacterium]